MSTITRSERARYRKNIKECRKRQDIIKKLNDDRVSKTLADLKGVELKAKVKIKCGLYSGLPEGIKKQLLRLSDYVNDRNGLRIQQTECKKYCQFKNLYVIYAILNNGEVVAWANYWKNRKGFKQDQDKFVFFHVKKKYRRNKIGRRLFKEVYKRLVKGKKDQRSFFHPKFNNDIHGYFKGADFYSRMLRLAKSKEI